MQVNYRDNAQSMIYEYDDLNGKRQGLHFSEWWNGEGIDVTLTDDVTTVKLHMEDITAIVTAAIAFGMVNLKECKELVKSCK
jgi:paraquat-inducible protein B